MYASSAADCVLCFKMRRPPYRLKRVLFYLPA